MADNCQNTLHHHRWFREGTKTSELIFSLPAFFLFLITTWIRENEPRWRQCAEYWATVLSISIISAWHFPRVSLGLFHFSRLFRKPLEPGYLFDVLGRDLVAKGGQQSSCIGIQCFTVANVAIIIAQNKHIILQISFLNTWPSTRYPRPHALDPRQLPKLKSQLYTWVPRFRGREVQKRSA